MDGRRVKSLRGKIMAADKKIMAALEVLDQQQGEKSES